MIEEQQRTLTVLFLNAPARYRAPLSPNSLYFKFSILKVYQNNKNISEETRKQPKLLDYQLEL